MARSTTDVETSFWSAGTPEAEFLAGRFGGFAYDPHSHDRACLALITRGAIRIRMHHCEFVARAGDLYAIDAEVVHAGWPVDAEGWSLRTIYVDCGRLAALFDDDGAGRRDDHIRGPVIRDDRLRTLFLDLHRATERGAAALDLDRRWLAFSRHFLAAYTTAEPSDAEPGREPAAVRRARDFLEAHLADSVRLAEVAAAAGLPTHRLHRAFVRATGLTPHAHQRQTRVRVAAELLRAGMAPAEVAAAVGFVDQAHLTHGFRRRMAITPGVFRSAHLARDAVPRPTGGIDPT